jgi:hypothetical protein
MANNVALVRRLADGGALCPVPIAERSGCFCTRGAMQGYDAFLFIVMLVKKPDKPGQAVTPRWEPTAPAVAARPATTYRHPITRLSR